MWTQNSALSIQGNPVCKPQKRGATAPSVLADKKQPTLPVASVAPQLCPCQHSLTSATVLNNNPFPSQPLSQQYVRSLEQQIQLLEYENNFLKREQPKYDTTTPKTILTQGNKVSLNGRDWCTLPTTHPPLHALIAQRIVDDAIGPTPSTRDGKRSATGSQRGSTAQRRSPIAEEDELESELNRREFGKGTMKNGEDMRVKLENVKKHNAELKERLTTLSSRLDEAEKLLSSRNENDVREKRALIEENLELQMRLDELTPVIAEKEKSISRLVSEKDELTEAIRRANYELTQIKSREAERAKQEDIRSGRERTWREEREKMQKRIEEYENRQAEMEEREKEIINETNELKRQRREDEMQLEQGKIISQQLLIENKKLIEENAQLGAELSRLQLAMKTVREREREEMSKDRENSVQEMRTTIESQRTQIETLEERLRTTEERYAITLEETRTRRDESDDIQRERLRIQKELSALQALASSLSSENKLLREEKSRLLEKVNQLKDKLLAKELAMKKLEDEIAETIRARGEVLERAEEESRAREMRSQQLADIVRRLQQISSDSPASSHRLSSPPPPSHQQHHHHNPIHFHHPHYSSICGMAPPTSAHSTL